MKTVFFISFLLIVNVTKAQEPYREGNTVKDFTAPVVLNYTSSSSSLYNMSADITIIDFFGTWCVPCLKALPQLELIHKTFKDKVNVILISTEKKDKLEKFIQAKKISLPVIADEGSVISNFFQPPSYPYTLVLDKNKKIIAITEAAAITKENISEWLAGKNTEKNIGTELSKKISALNSIMNNNNRSNNKIVALSQELLYAAKTGEMTEPWIEKIRNIPYENLLKELKNDEEKKAFWINAYNGYTQALLIKNPDAYNNRGTFFKSRQIIIAGKKFSLDDIEHGILRRNKVKWSLGYFNKIFPRKINKQLKVDKLDYRIHFALNCGAKSCPPLAFYNSDNLEEQLNITTTAYLAGEALYDSEKNKLGLPAIMGWFRRDFGGKKKMLELVKERGIVPEAKKPSIYFTKYNWQLHLNNF